MIIITCILKTKTDHLEDLDRGGMSHVGVTVDMGLDWQIDTNNFNTKDYCNYNT
jgi:hypothetical protein